MRFVKLNSICTFKQWKTLPIKELLPIGYPVYGANGIIGYSSSYNHTTPTLMICCRGATCGAINASFGKCYINGNAMALDNLSSEFDFDYVRMFLKHFDFSKIVTGAAQPQITQIGLSTIQIPKPSLEQQRHISKQLLHFETLINVKYTELSDLDSLVKSRFIDMFKEWNLSFQKENWIKLSDLTNIYTGTTPKTEIEEYWNGLIPWVTPAELDKDSYLITDTERHITKKGQKSKSLTMMPIGTVLLSTRAPIGKVAICGVPMTCNQGFKNFECLEKLHPTYLFYLLKLNNDWLQTQGTGTTFKEISKSKAGNIRIPVPTMSDQKDFAQFYNLVDKSRFDQGIQNA